MIFVSDLIPVVIVEHECEAFKTRAISEEGDHVAHFSIARIFVDVV